MEQSPRATAALAALAAPVERAAIAALAALAAVALPGLAAAVVLAWQALAALVAVAAQAAPAGMRVVSAMARLVGMPEQVALVASAELRARRARTPQRYLAVPAVLVATLEWQVRALLVSAA